MDLLDRLLNHDHWATTQLLEASRDLTDAQLDQDFDIGHRTLRETFNHLIFNIETWTDLMAGEQVDVKRDDQSVPVLTDRHERAYARFAAFARRMLDEGRLDDTFTDSWAEQLSIGGATLHVILHNEGHRTEALHILQRLGRPEIEIDHALWDLSVRLA